MEIYQTEGNKLYHIIADAETLPNIKLLPDELKSYCIVWKPEACTTSTNDYYANMECGYHTLTIIIWL